MLDRNNTIVADLAPAGATPTLDTLPRRIADFATLGEALDYLEQAAKEVKAEVTTYEKIVKDAGIKFE